MLDPNLALHAAARSPQPAARALPALRRVWVLGGGGRLGSTVVEQLLASRRFDSVGVAIRRPVSPALRGLQPVVDDAAALAAFRADVAVIVFDGERHANGRDEAFARPLPDELVPRARAVQAAGIGHLLVAVPHATAQLPQALRVGLASLDEAAVAALGFDQLVFMRLAQSAGSRGPIAGAPQRLAHWMLRQLHWMVPSSEQPVRAETVARVVRAVLAGWLSAVPATRVLPPALLWHAAQGADVDALVERWLRGEPLPPVQAPRQRW